jgi:flagellar hook-length control protein FliK
MAGIPAVPGEIRADSAAPAKADQGNTPAGGQSAAISKESSQNAVAVKRADASGQQTDVGVTLFSEQASAEDGKRGVAKTLTGEAVRLNVNQKNDFPDLPAGGQPSTTHPAIEPLESGISQLIEEYQPSKEEPIVPESRKRLVSLETSGSPDDDHAHVIALHHSVGQTNASGALSSGGQVQRTGAARSAELVEPAVPLIPNSNQVAVTLEPDGLGQVRINLRLDQGLVHGQFRVSDDHVRTLIGNNIQNLVETLTRDGLSVGGFTVSLHQGGQHTGANGSFPSSSVQVQAEASEADRQAQVVTDRLINIFV